MKAEKYICVGEWLLCTICWCFNSSFIFVLRCGWINLAGKIKWKIQQKNSYSMRILITKIGHLSSAAIIHLIVNFYVVDWERQLNRLYELNLHKYIKLKKNRSHIFQSNDLLYFHSWSQFEYNTSQQLCMALQLMTILTSTTYTLLQNQMYFPCIKNISICLSYK